MITCFYMDLKHVVAPNIFSLWSGLDDEIFNQKESFGLAQQFHGKKWKKKIDL